MFSIYMYVNFNWTTGLYPNRMKDGTENDRNKSFNKLITDVCLYVWDQIY